MQSWAAARLMCIPSFIPLVRPCLVECLPSCLPCSGVAEGLTIASTFTKSDPAAYHHKRSAERARTGDGPGGGGVERAAEAATAPSGPPAAASDCGGGGGSPDTVMPDAERAPEPRVEAEPAAAPEAAADPPPIISFKEYYRARWGVEDLAADQPLLHATRVSRQQLMRGLDVPRGSGRQLRDSGQALGPGGEVVGGAEDGGMFRVCLLKQGLQPLSPWLHRNAPPEPTAAEDVVMLPQLCVVHPVPVALWRPLSALPSLMWQLEGALLAEQLLREMLPAGLPADK